MRIVGFLKALVRLPTNVREAKEAVARLEDRLEFVRRELFFEIKYGRQERRESEAREVRIVDEAKVEAAKAAGLRLNIGCGHVALPGYVNVDMRAVPGVDVVAGVDELPFDPGAAIEISSTHVLEHFPQEMLKRRLLPFWREILASGGTFRAVVPDAKAMLRRVQAGDYPFEDFREVFFGAQDYEGDFHYNMFTPESLGTLLRDAGFVDVETRRQGVRNGRCYEFEIVARKP